MKRLHFALLALVLALGAFQYGTAAPSRHSAVQTNPFATTGYCADSEDMAFLQLINDYRAQNGLGPLALSQKLADASYYHSSDMATKNYFSHTFADGTTWDQNIRNFGYTYNTSMGENIAAGYATAATVFTAWKNSPGHNANMLTSGFKAIGIARAYSSTSTYGWYWTTDFGGVVDGAGAVCGASSSPTATPTKTATSLPTATKTSTPVPTATKTSTPVATATKTSTPVPTATKIATPVPTATKTSTPLPTATKTPTKAATPTKTATPRPATATPTTAPSTISYVNGLSGSASGSTLSITATIRDSAGRYVTGAVVTIQFAAPTGAVQSLAATTDSRGQAKWSVKTTAGTGVYRVSVVDVSASNRPYDPNRNRVASIAITVR